MNTQEKITSLVGQATDSFLSLLKQRSSNIIERRFGLTIGSTPETLDAIGQTYSITRERVRQIQESSFKQIIKDDAYKNAQTLRELLIVIFEEKGKMCSENELLESITNEIEIQKQIVFFITLCDEFTRYEKINEYIAYWTIKSTLSRKVFSAMNSLYSHLPNTLISEEKLMFHFMRALGKVGVAYQSRDTLLRWLSLYKKILKNPFGEWGKDTASGIKLSGIKDYAYLTLRKHGVPMHFSELAKNITETCGIPCHKATCHNELIKDDRFILIGRGIYALRENGYTPGFARDIISDILEENGPLSKEEIVSKVLKKRVLKENTILVGLQNSEYFTKNKKNGKYSIAK